MINNNYSTARRPAFKARFLNSESMKQIADYAIQHGKFEKLNQARKNIESSHLRTRLLVDTGVTSKGFPFISFTRFVPKSDVIVPKTMQDLRQEKVVTFLTESSKIKNPIKFALEKLIRMGNDVPHNNIFKKTVIEK